MVLDIRMGAEERGWSILNLLTLDPETRPIPVIECRLTGIRRSHAAGRVAGPVASVRIESRLAPAPGDCGRSAIRGKNRAFRALV